MKPFKKAIFKNPNPELIKLVMKEKNMTNDEASDWILNKLGIPYINDEFQVNVFHINDYLIQLSIRRKDKEPIDKDHWEILQEIKNMVIGKENEGVELFPAESRRLNNSTQYFMYVLSNSKDKFYFGFN